MSKSVYRLRRGLAHVLITGEPVFVNTISTDGQTANVTRPVLDGNSGTVRYLEENLRTELLETPQAQIRRKLALDDFARKQMQRMEDKRWSLTPKQISDIETAAKTGKLLEVN